MLIRLAQAGETVSEIARIRLIRSPQRICGTNKNRIELYPGGMLSEFAKMVLTPKAPDFGGEVLAPATPERNIILTSFFESQGLSETSIDVVSSITELDQWLLCKNDRPSQKELLAYLTSHAPPEAPRSSYRANASIPERVRLADLLLASFLYNCTPALRVRITRLLMVTALIELLRNHPSKVSTEHEIFSALRWRTIVMPRELYDLFESFELRRARPIRSGFSDLFMARDEWIRYEAGEISHIENVRAGELKDRKLFRMTEREDTVTEESEKTTLNERSTESTDRFELADETSREMNLSLSVEASVDTSGQYGPTQVDTHLGGSLDYSQSEASSRATTQIKESVTRALTRIEEKVRQQRVTRSLTRTEASDIHSLKNDSTKDRVSVYRWVDKIKRVQIFRYPNRYLLEFEIPEPGAWWRWLLGQPQTISTNSPKPLPLTQSGNDPQNRDDRLKPTDVTIDNYQALGARYFALGLAPPPSKKIIAVQVSSTSDMGGKNDVVYTVDKSLTVPDGYVAMTWKANVMWSPRSSPGAGTGSVTIAVGVSTNASAVGYTATGAKPVYLAGSVGAINIGSIPIVVDGYMTDSYTANVTVECDPTSDEMTRWKIRTYERLSAAYAEMQRQYDEEHRSIVDSIPSLADRYSPGRNQEILKEELKKHVISMLTGVDFSGRKGLDLATSNNEPFINIDDAERIGPEMQFIEQAFEWANISYVLYPYFWADRTRWIQIASLDGADADFVRFLRSGSARVVVPARPGFEAQVQLYSKFGVLWGGGPVPAPNEPDYLSIADEIMSQQRPPKDGERGESWEVRLPTSLVCIGDGGGLPANEGAKLDVPPGKTLS